MKNLVLPASVTFMLILSSSVFSSDDWEAELNKDMSVPQSVPGGMMQLFDEAAKARAEKLEKFSREIDAMSPEEMQRENIKLSKNNLDRILDEQVAVVKEKGRFNSLKLNMNAGGETIAIIDSIVTLLDNRENILSDMHDYYSKPYSERKKEEPAVSYINQLKQNTISLELQRKKYKFSLKK